WGPAPAGRGCGGGTPGRGWETARATARREADGIFLSCTNTTQIEAIEEIEQALGKPVVNSNQAVLWGCLKRLGSALGPLPPMPELGRLMGRRDGGRGTPFVGDGHAPRLHLSPRSGRGRLA